MAELPDEELVRRFTYHPPPDEATVQKYQRLREKARELATMIRDDCPHSRESSLALTNLEEAIMWANAAIARRS